jgi:ATP-dependent Clp protease ATP-binding subunit ClpC
MKLLKSFLAEMRVALTSQKQLSQHFTPRGRDIFALAEDEAVQLNHNFIGTEHVLLGLLNLDRGVGANVLRRQGVDLKKVRTSVEEYVGRAPDVKILKPIPFTPRVKAALITAHQEARALNHSYVGTEHVLLGLLGEKDGVAARVLKASD